MLTGQHLGQGEEGGVVGHEAGGEHQRAVLPVQLGQLSLQVTWMLLVPEMFLVPPAPAPCFSRASLVHRHTWHITSVFLLGLVLIMEGLFPP